MADLGVKSCPVRGCSHWREAAHVACKVCWAKVPAAMQKQVYASWGHVRKHATIEATQAHRALIAGVIKFLNDLQGPVVR